MIKMIKMIKNFFNRNKEFDLKLNKLINDFKLNSNISTTRKMLDKDHLKRYLLSKKDRVLMSKIIYLENSDIESVGARVGLSYQLRDILTVLFLNPKKSYKRFYKKHKDWIDEK